MAGKFKILSGKQIAKIMASFGFVVFSQSGSHIKMKRFSLGIKETLIIPNHSPISKGTLKAIFNQASKYITETELKKHFCN
jgi:predicted RNA binding protein YcfA (HicA-like mRNA interferase family)